MTYVIGQKFNQEGVWKTYRGLEICVARAGNREFNARLENLRRPYRKKIDRGTLSDEISLDLTLTAISETILLDWKGAVNVDADGNAEKVKYTPEIGKQQMKDDPELLEFVMDVAADNDNYRLEEVEATVGKSKKS